MTGTMSEAEIRAVNLIEVKFFKIICSIVAALAASKLCFEVLRYTQDRSTAVLIEIVYLCSLCEQLFVQILMEEAEEEGKAISRPPEDARKWSVILSSCILILLLLLFITKHFF